MDGLLIAGEASSGTIVSAPAAGAAGIVVGLFAPDKDESPAPKRDSRLGE